MTAGGSSFDAIVIGGGHNGLVCAAYLSRAGLRTVVLERRERVGGMAETVERWPGVHVPTLAHTVGRLRPDVARDLQLRDHGLRLVEPDVRVFAPQADGGGIVLYGDVSRTAESLRVNQLLAPRDAQRYPEVDTEFRALARALTTLYDDAPPDLASPSLGDVVGGVRRLAKVRARTPVQAASGGLMRVMPMAVRDLVDEWFESDALRAVVAARGVLLTGLGPRMPGTAGVLLTDAAGSDAGLAGRAVFARDGPGALTDALRLAARGAVVTTGVSVERVLTRDGAAVGVRLADGDEFEADIVVSTLDPRTTLLKLIEPEVLGPRLGWRASNIRQTGVTAKVNFALRDLPRFVGASDPSVLRGRILISPSMSALDVAMTPAKYGRQADEPLIEATIPTLVDPGLIDAKRSGDVRHVFSAIVQAAVDESIGDVATRTLERYAPGFADLVVDRDVITPRDLERDWGADGGHPMHAEVSLDQWFEWRPLHGFGRYRTPVRGMYLAGAGAHPGGGVTGGPGQLAAQAILEDRKA